MSCPLSFGRVREANAERAKLWHHEDTVPWTGADWSNAMCGEAGEVANVVKKLRRADTGCSSPTDAEVDVLRTQLAYEIADTFLYLDLLADYYGIDLPPAIVAKFNIVSKREGFDVYL